MIAESTTIESESIRSVITSYSNRDAAIIHKTMLIAAPARTWEDAADKVRYLLSVFATTQSGQDPRRLILIKAVLNDFDRLSDETVER